MSDKLVMIDPQYGQLGNAHILIERTKTLAAIHGSVSVMAPTRLVYERLKLVFEDQPRVTILKEFEDES